MMVRWPPTAGLTVLLSLLDPAFGPPVHAQFKEIGPAPFSSAVAHQRIRILLDRVEPANRQQTLDQLNGLVPWFRSVLDEELAAGWQRESRERLLLVIPALADARVATAVVEFSWRTRTDATLSPSYAGVLGDLMARYPESGRTFLSDLLGPTPPELSPSQSETVCRILLDMPDIGTWNESALKILPRYRATAERLLAQDRQSGDQEKFYRAQTWLAQLRGEAPGAANPTPLARRRAVSGTPERNQGPLFYPPPADTPSNNTVQRRENSAPDSAPARPPLPGVPAAQPPVPPQPVAPGPTASQQYSGPMSGTLECSGPVPQNAEYVFRNLPPLKMQLDYDQRVWEARLSPGENQSQRLILRNKSSGPQKRCTVHWRIVP